MNEQLNAIDAKLSALHMRGQWKSEEFLQRAIGGPAPAGQPVLWRWPDVDRLLQEISVAMPESALARRSLVLGNPELPRGTTQTMNLAVQMTLPGEIAWAHRHSISAFRFVLEGSSELFTVVNGHRCPMQDHDLIVTPNWAWHDHHNHSDRKAYWLDILDVPLVLGLNQTFYEPYGDKAQPLTDASAIDDGSLKSIHYPWRDIYPALMSECLSGIHPHRGVLLAYTDANGRSVTPTMACAVQLLPKGFESKLLRQTASAICCVINGSGSTFVGGEEIRWNKHDCFVIPNWSWHCHRNSSSSDDAVLFLVDDSPALRALHFYREEFGGARVV